MDEYLGGDGVAVVEWPAQCPDAVPENAVRIRLETTGENERTIDIGALVPEYEDTGN